MQGSVFSHRQFHGPPPPPPPPHFFETLLKLPSVEHPAPTCWPGGKASNSRAAEPRWVRRLALQGQRWDWLARCQFHGPPPLPPPAPPVSLRHSSSCLVLNTLHRLVGLVVRCQTPEPQIRGSIPSSAVGQTLGVMESALGLVGPVSVSKAHPPPPPISLRHSSSCRVSGPPAPPCWPSGEVSVPRAADPWVRLLLAPWARRLALQGQRWDWLVRCQYDMTG